MNISPEGADSEGETRFYSERQIYFDVHYKR